jgi:hypothetical protein
MNEAELFELFKDKSLLYGPELIVKKKHCSVFVRASKSAGLAVIGIEGFHLLEDGRVEPNLDEIADFSDIKCGEDPAEYIEACFEAANRFIVNMNFSGESDGYCFTLTSLEK